MVWLDYLAPGEPPPPGYAAFGDLLATPEPAAFAFERVDDRHPLWVVFSSGTTGAPKAIVHGHTGILIEHLKLTRLHLDLGPDSTLFFYTTTGWMMWNILLSALLAGGAAVLYDGSPAHPDLNRLWNLAAEARATSFGASPTFVQMMDKAGLRPRDTHDLSALQSVIVAGAPSTPETFAWLYDAVADELAVTSQSGGTEICSGFVGQVATLPVYAGEIQAAMLGMDVRAWDADGQQVPPGTIGELVVPTAFPSQPQYFLNDPDGAKYTAAYFDMYPGVWRHGDFIKLNARGGAYIYGRSDSTLNRHGVRIGTAEIYRVVEAVEGVADSLIVCCELPGGDFHMPLFVRTKPGVALDDALKSRINVALRTDCSPRHVPDVIHAVGSIPYTLTAKKMEIPVRRILLGARPEAVASKDAMLDPAALEAYTKFAVMEAA